METRLGIVLICLLVTQVAARGGGRTSGGSDSSSSHDRDYDHNDRRDHYNRRDQYDRRDYNTYSNTNHYSHGSSSGGWSNWSNDSGSYWGTLWVPQWVVSLLVVAIFVSCCCCCCCLSGNKRSRGAPKESVNQRRVSDEGITPCYLCLNDVRNSAWDSGDHRRRCAFQNQGELLWLYTCDIRVK